MPSSPTDENSSGSSAAAVCLGGATPRELLSGIDSLDLTCKTPGSVGLLSELASLKGLAGEKPREAVVLAVGKADFQVAATGMGPWWPYRLVHKFGQAAVGDSPNRPAWKLSLSAEALHTEGPVAVVKFWQDALEALTSAECNLRATRLDVHADFAGLGITEADRPLFVCRAERESVEVSAGSLETLYWGKGGDVVARIYDKLAEIDATGKGGYVLDLYGRSGLAVGEQVQRVEAQVRGDALKSMNIMSAKDAVDRAGEVYLYVVGKWLRLTDPVTATRRERAALDARWAAVVAARIAAGDSAAQRIGAQRNAPALKNLVPMLAGLTVSAGAALGISEFDEAWSRLSHLVAGYMEDRGRDFTREVSTRMEFGPS